MYRTYHKYVLTPNLSVECYTQNVLQGPLHKIIAYTLAKDYVHICCNCNIALQFQ